MEQGTQPVPSGCDPVIGVQRDPASVAQWGFLCSVGVQGVSEEVRGHTHPEQTHPPKEKGARRVALHPGEGGGYFSLLVWDLNFWGLDIEGCSEICRSPVTVCEYLVLWFIYWHWS